MKRIYLDYAALTPIDKNVLKIMNEYSSSVYGNPSSLYEEGVGAKKVLQNARAEIAHFFKAHPDEIIFTGSGTEANNLAIHGIIEHFIHKGVPASELHLITSAIEHASVLECVRALEKRGVQTDYVGVDERGFIDTAELKRKIKPETILISVMMVNNEIGTIEPIHEISKIIRHAQKTIRFLHAAKPYLHTDASQAPLYLPLEVEKLGVDLMTVDGHKVYGPRGIGALLVKRSVPLVPIIRGGGQENGRRSGTENIPAIAGLAYAFTKAARLFSSEAERVTVLRNYCMQKLRGLKGIEFNGGEEGYVPHIVNISLPDIDNEFLLLKLDAAGIACATKSSCLRDEHESYVIRALGKSDWQTRNSIRFSFGRETKKKDIDYLYKVLSKCVSKQ